MNLGDIFGKSLSSIPRFVREFVNLLLSPREYAASGQVFVAERLNAALAFLGFSIIVTFVIKTPMFINKPGTLSFLSAAAVWKFVFVLLETVIISATWRTVRGKGTFADYLVANCLYFGVLTIIGHLAILLMYSIQRQPIGGIPQDILLPLIVVIFGGAIVVWAFSCWQAYGDFNKVGVGERTTTLIIVGTVSIPVFFIGERLWFQLLGSFFPTVPWH